MKLLFLTPQLPYPPHQGTTIRNFNILKGLATRHSIDLISFGTSTELAGSPLPELCQRIEIVPPPPRSLSRRALETFISPLPDMARRLDSPALVVQLGQRLSSEQYDVIQIEGIEMARAWLEVRGWKLEVAPGPAFGVRSRKLEAGRLVQPPISVFDDHNAEYILQKTAYESDRRVKRLHGALYSYLQWHKLARFERALCLRANQVVAVSRQDAEALTALDPAIQPVVIPNGVDIDAYIPSDEVCAKPLAELATVFTGKMDFRPNVDAAIWFTNEILPILRREIPLAHVSFVGQKPSARVQALAAVPGVQVTGWVPDTRPYIADAAVYVVPLRMGGGTRLKVLEALAMGKAIVSTTLGAEGIDYTPGRELVIADRADDFAQAVAALVRDPARRRVLGTNARRLAEAKYDWEKIVPQFEALYAQRRNG